MNIHFYAPMKTPDHPSPSGDRLMARLLMRVLAAAGHQLALPSLVCAYDGAGAHRHQQQIRDLASALADRLLAGYAQGAAKPDIWFSYHVYHKSPDWIGPVVARALSIPYVIAEASYVTQAVAGWELGARAAELAIRSADLIFSMTDVDKVGIAPLRTGRQLHLDLPPFLDPSPFYNLARVSRAQGEPVRLLAVAMMREGDKLESYRRLAAYLQCCKRQDWRLTIAGDGPARADVETALAPLGAGRVSYLGLVADAGMPQVYANADLFVWPAAGEAYGMAILEAQAAGLPVVAGRGRGVANVVCDGKTGFLTPDGDGEAFAGVVDFLIADAAARRETGAAAAHFVRAERSLDGAASILRHGLCMLASKLARPGK